jgi:hypothetical protein
MIGITKLQEFASLLTRKIDMRVLFFLHPTIKGRKRSALIKLAERSIKSLEG